jgi:autotransporter passenger strand-loop-strand repeat protein
VQTVLLGGSATGATVSNGGNQIISGVAQSTLVNSGGMLTVSSGGQANALMVQSGGSALVLSGGAFSGATIIGGRLEISSGGLAISSTVAFVGNSGTLQLGANKYRGKIEGFTGADTIDLLAIAYNSGTTTLGYLDNGTGSGGTLTVSDGVHTAKLTMIGAYVMENFKLSTDSHGGTLITDPPVSSGADLVTPH